MKYNKIGTIFLASIFALAGLGVSFAGLSDVLYVYGTVNTATVELVVEDYSGTIVWKIWNCPQGYNPGIDGLTTNCEDELAIWTGLELPLPTEVASIKIAE